MELRRKFFQYHTQTNRFDGVKTGCNPNALVLNPIQNEHNINTWFAIYCRKYFVTVQQSVTNPLSGPHVAKLFIKIPGEFGSYRSEWIGTAQFVRPFFNEEELRIALRKAIRTRQYFCSEEVESIELYIPSDPPARTKPRLLQTASVSSNYSKRIRRNPLTLAQMLSRFRIRGTSFEHPRQYQTKPRETESIYLLEGGRPLRNGIEEVTRGGICHRPDIWFRNKGFCNGCKLYKYCLRKQKRLTHQ